MTWVKLCGMTRESDVRLAAEIGADAVGFVIAPESPRRIECATAARIGERFPGARYLVTVDLDPEDLLEYASHAGVTGVQPHGRHSVEAARAALSSGLDVLFPVPVADSLDLGSVPDGSTPILDTAVAGLHGGSGRRFDWSLAAGIEAEFVLAGGLDPENVVEAVGESGAWGVDVASGVEKEPGVKDPAAMRRFVEAVR